MRRAAFVILLLFGVSLFSGCFDSNIFLENTSALQSAVNGEVSRVSVAVRFNPQSASYSLSEMEETEDGFLYRMSPTDSFEYYFVVNGQNLIDTRIFKDAVSPADYFVDDGSGGFNALCIPFKSQKKKVEIDFSLTAATALMNLIGVGSFEQIEPEILIFNEQTGSFEATALAYDDGFYKAKIQHSGKVMEYFIRLNGREITDMRFFAEILSPAPQYFADNEKGGFTAIYLN